MYILSQFFPAVSVIWVIIPAYSKEWSKKKNRCLLKSTDLTFYSFFSPFSLEFQAWKILFLSDSKVIVTSFVWCPTRFFTILQYTLAFFIMYWYRQIFLFFFTSFIYFCKWDSNLTFLVKIMILSYKVCLKKSTLKSYLLDLILPWQTLIH